MSHVMCYKLHDARECVLPPGNLWKPPASSPPLRVEPPRMGGTPCLPVQPASGLRLGSARVLALAHRGMPRRAASSAAATSVAQRHSRAGDTPAPHGSLRLPRPPSGRAPAQGIPLASPYSPLAGCVSALPAYSLSLVAACLDVPPSTGGEGGTPLHPLARLLPRQSAARKRSDTCRETRGLVRSVSRYVTSSPSHSGRHEELHPLFYALSLCK